MSFYLFSLLIDLHYVAFFLFFSIFGLKSTIFVWKKGTYGAGQWKSCSKPWNVSPHLGGSDILSVLKAKVVRKREGGGRETKKSESRILEWTQTPRQSCISVLHTVWLLHSVGGHCHRTKNYNRRSGMLVYCHTECIHFILWPSCVCTKSETFSYNRCVKSIIPCSSQSVEGFFNLTFDLAIQHITTLTVLVHLQLLCQVNFTLTFSSGRDSDHSGPVHTELN